MYCLPIMRWLSWISLTVTGISRPTCVGTKHQTNQPHKQETTRRRMAASGFGAPGSCAARKATAGSADHPSRARGDGACNAPLLERAAQRPRVAVATGAAGCKATYDLSDAQHYAQPVRDVVDEHARRCVGRVNIRAPCTVRDGLPHQWQCTHTGKVPRVVSVQAACSGVRAWPPPSPWKRG